MAEIVTLAAERRDRAGKGAARATRRSERVPGVIYGDKKPPILISVEQRALERVAGKESFFAKLATVTVDGESFKVLPREVQLDPVSDRAIHCDFLRVGPKTRITVAVPIHFENEAASPGLKRGGVLNVVRHAVEVYCLADSIPDAFTADLTGLDIGDSIHISHVKLPEGVKPTIARDFTIASVAAPTVYVEEAPVAAAATAEGEAAAAPGAEGAAAAPAAGAAGAAPAAGDEKKPAQKK
ncbi:MAG: 50S ribosomal protein L25/general stress protein Ctc [Alphaproteobacteria bacterium]|nr:50S ribosomal protein L25/general stress protein Ctc [Alphaproteobacteria bacterium]